MIEFLRPTAEWATAIMELIGIVIIVGIALLALTLAAIRLLQRKDSAEVIHTLRQRVGAGILLGLEFLVAADIIETIAVELSFETVGVLAIVVLIRTFLSFTLEVELNGRWPWQDEEPAKPT